MHSRLWPVWLVALAFVTASCGGDNGPAGPPASNKDAATSASRATTTGSSGSSKLPDPCTLLTSDQVRALYTVPVLDGEHAGNSQCTWRPRDVAQAFAGVTLGVQIDVNSSFEMTRSSASRHKDVIGVGDSAFLVDPAAGNVLWFKRGNINYILTIAAARTPDQLQQDVVTLAKEILAH